MIVPPVPELASADFTPSVHGLLHTIDTRIGGVAHASQSGRHGAVWNPANHQPFTHVNFADVDVILDVDSARRLSPPGEPLSYSPRAEILSRLRSMIDQRCEDLGSHSLEGNGKSLADACGEIARGIEDVEFACGTRGKVVTSGRTDPSSRKVDLGTHRIDDAYGADQPR